MTVKEQYQRRARWLLTRHGIRQIPCEPQWALAHSSENVIRAPEPVDAKSFYIFAHEVAHCILPGHKYMDWGASEIEADLWAVAELKRVRGWVPVTITRSVNARAATLTADAISSGRLPLAKLVDIGK